MVMPTYLLLTYLLTYLLTPCSRVLEKLTVPQLVKKFHTFYRTRRFITAFTSARHLSLPWARSTQSIPPHPTSWRPILILQRISPGPWYVYPFRNKASFYGKELLVPRPTTKPVGHQSSAVRDCLYSIFAATFLTGGRSAIRNLKMRHAVVTGTRYHGVITLYFLRVQNGFVRL